MMSAYLDVKMEFILPILLLSLVLVECSNANEVKPAKCKPGEFFKISTKGGGGIDGKCTKCSNCPPNHMIAQPCGGFRDSKCEAFIISTFNIGPSDDEESVPGSEGVRCQNEDKLLNLKTSAEFWRDMSFSLIGVSCVLICVIIVVSVQYVRGRRYYPYKTVDGELARRSRVFSRDRCNTTEHQHRRLSALESLEAQLSRGDARVLIGADGHQYIDEVFSRDPGMGPSGGPGHAQPLQPPILVPNLTANKPTTVSWTPNGMIVMDSQYSKCPKRGNRV